MRRCLTLALQIALVTLLASPALAQVCPIGRSRSSCHSRPAERRMRCRASSPTFCRANGANRSSSITGRARPVTSAPKPSVYHAPPDGYTLLSAPPPPLVINHNLYPKLGFDPTKFEPIIVDGAGSERTDRQSQAIKAASVPELIAYLKENPDKVLVATQGSAARRI